MTGFHNTHHTVRLRFASLLLLTAALVAAASAANAQQTVYTSAVPCRDWEPDAMTRNPTPHELRCRYGVHGPGRFGRIEYADVAVYRPATPLPGSHTVGIPGLPSPRPGESYERWEWRLLRTQFGDEVLRPRTDLESVHPFFAARLISLERTLRREGIPHSRRETWRPPERQAYIFQSGRSRPGGLATATLTSWHSYVDERGNPAALAVDYNVPRRWMPRFHELAGELGIRSFGADSNDPGHLFLPEPAVPSGRELAFLRLLPRVTVVTLATGRPRQETVSVSALAQHRRASREFAASPFVPVPVPRIAGHDLRPPVIVAPLGDGVADDPPLASP